MNAVKKAISALLIGALGVGGFFAGTEIVRDVRFAYAQEKVESSREELQKVDDIYGVYRVVGKTVEPSVVSIEVHKTVRRGNVHQGMPFDEDVLKRFFPDRDGDGEPDVPRGFRMPEGGEFDRVAGGSGVIMEATDGKGWIVTNHHVAGGADSMTITLMDGRKIKKAKVVGTDPKSDLALIEIEADNLIPARWGDSDKLAKGDVIFAFGSPFGYVGSMTHGIVSALNRQNVGILSRQSGFAYENFIQVDAPINPGNSGGPLANLRGEIVGINTAIATETGAFNGIGFAIPSNQAKGVYEQLKTRGKVVRGYIGVKIQDVADDVPLAQSFGYKGETGVLVQELYEETPAWGKLREGDIITAINGKAVKDGHELRTKVAATAPGTDTNFTVSRNGKTVDVTIKIGEQPDELTSLRRGTSGDEAEGGTADASDQTSPKSLGLTIATANEDLLARFGLEEASGAIVTGVERRSPAARAGISVGDVITQVGDQNVSSAREATDALKKQDLKQGIRLKITSRMGSRFVLVREEE